MRLEKRASARAIVILSAEDHARRACSVALLSSAVRASSRDRVGPGQARACRRSPCRGALRQRVLAQRTLPDRGDEGARLVPPGGGTQGECLRPGLLTYPRVEAQARTPRRRADP